MKNFYEKWSEDEIREYVGKYHILILFAIYVATREAKLKIYGNINDKQKGLLKTCILGKFGGKDVTEDLTIRINEYAEEWYENYIVSRKIRVLNFGRGK